MAEKPKSKDAPKLPDTTPVTSQPTNEQAVTTSTPKFVRKSTVAVTSPTSEEQMIAAYDIGDTGFDPELDGIGNDLILETEKQAETTDSEKPAEAKERFDQLNDYPVGKTAEGETEQPAEAPKSKHPEWLTAMAVKAGIKPSMIERVDSDSLGEMIADYNELRRPQEQRREKEPEPEEEDDLGDLAESLDPRMLKRLNEAKELKKRLAGLEQKLNMQEKTVQQQREEQAYAEIDAVFDEASEKLGGLLGKGRSNALSPSSPILERRKMIMASAKLGTDKDQSKPLRQCLNEAITML